MGVSRALNVSPHFQQPQTANRKPQTTQNMEQEIELPPMPVSQEIQPAELPDLNHKRKRPRCEYDLTTSSDPALFSSDDHAPTAENYASKRRKEKWRGTWWGEKLKGHSSTSSNGGKRKFARNFDSGVWMGSEGTDASLEDELLEDLRSAERQATTLTSPVRSEQDVRVWGNDAAVLEDFDRPKVRWHQPRQTAAQTARNSSLYAAVENIIDRCLEAGDENVDLSSMSLDSVPNESLKRLRSLTKHSTIQEIPPSQDTYSPIEAALRLYISNNLLIGFPSEILGLTNLRFLSLRNNNLTRIPPAIAKLPHLQHLNIGGNELPYLPYAMLRLHERTEFEMIPTPNPFEQLPSEHSISPCDPDLPLGDQPILVARSTRTYFHINGSKTNDTAFAASPGLPSLLELALKKCKHLPELSDLKDWCNVEEGPETLSRPLTLAQEATEYGDLECTTCGKPFIIPRVQWLEWWRSPSGWKPALGRSLDNAPFAPSGM